MSESTSSAAHQMQLLHNQRLEEEAAAAAAASASTIAAPSVVASADDEENVPASTVQSTPRKAPSLDVNSISMFPSLGSSSAPRPAAATWGAGPSSRIKSAAGKLGAVGDQRRSPAAKAAAAAAAGSDSRVSATSGLTQVRVVMPAIKPTAFGKVPVGEIVRTVMKATNTQIESSTSFVNGTTTFLISGKPEAIENAKRDLRSSFAEKITIQLPVPSSARPHILGSKGRTLANIQQKTGVKITIPPRDRQAGGDVLEAVSKEDDLEAEEEMVDITVEGDTESIKAAKVEIDEIIRKVCKITYRLTTIPATFYPFIAGARNANIQAIQTETDTRIQVPFHVAQEDDDEEEDAKDYAIVITGDKRNIRKAIDLIESNYQEMERTTRTLMVNIPKRQHKFLIGPKGVHLNEIHAATGCTIEIPPVASASDSIVIRGPESSLVNALTLVMEKANSSQIETVDVTTVHKVPAAQKLSHARNVSKYLSARSKLRKIEQEHEGVQIHVARPAEGETSVTIDIVAKSRAEVEAARKQVLAAVQAMTPGLFEVVVIEPLLHRHIVGRKGQNIHRLREAHNVEVIVPDSSSDSDEIVLVFEQPAEGTKTEAAQVKAALEAVKAELEKLALDATDFSTKTISVPAKLHRNIIGPKGSTLNAIMGLEPTTSVKLGLPRAGSADASASAKKGAAALTEDSIVVKGPKDEVDRVVREIQALAEETKHQQIMNSYSVTFDIPATASPHVIGKGGVNINKLTEQFQVKFDLNDRAAGADDNKPKKKSGTEMMEVTIQGVKKNVETAKEAVMKMVEHIADATVAKLNIPVEHHSALIGTKGHYVRRLEEKYGVRIQFPKAVDLEDGDTSALNSVVVSGGKKGVQGAKEELLELLDYEKENNNSLEIVVDAKVLPHIVGRNGVKINEIQEDSQARIDIRRSTDADEKPEVRLILNGTKAAIKKAQKSILDIVESQKSQVEELVSIENKYHKVLIGQGGSTLREIIAKAGGPTEMSQQASLVKFQNASNAVLLKGDKVIVEKIKAEMLRLVDEQESWTTLTITIPAAQHRQVIGPQFSNVKEIENRHNVRIQFPNKNTPKKEGESAAETAAANDRVTIKGLEANCQKAKVDLEAKIRTSASRSFSIPKKFRQAVYGDGVWKIRSEYNVVVILPKDGGRNNGNGAAASKRIDTEDENVTHGISEGISWELYDNSASAAADAEEAQFTVQLQGEESRIDAVVAHLESLLNKAKSSTHVLKMRVPTSYHGLIIGSGGNNIKNIEAESGCSTKVSRGEELITISGALSGIEVAKTHILRIVSTSEKRERGSDRN